MSPNTYVPQHTWYVTQHTCHPTHLSPNAYTCYPTHNYVTQHIWAPTHMFPNTLDMSPNIYHMLPNTYECYPTLLSNMIVFQTQSCWTTTHMCWVTCSPTDIKSVGEHSDCYPTYIPMLSNAYTQHISNSICVGYMCWGTLLYVLGNRSVGEHFSDPDLLMHRLSRGWRYPVGVISWVHKVIPWRHHRISRGWRF